MWVAGHIEDVDDTSLLTPSEADELLERRANIRWNFYDTWGVEGDNYLLLKVDHLLNGKLRPGTNMKNAVDSLRPADLRDKIHVVVFVAPLTSCEDEELMGTLNKQILSVSEACTRAPPSPPLSKTLKWVVTNSSSNLTAHRAIRPVVVVTFVDEVESEDKRQQMTNLMKSKLKHVAPVDIFAHKNYHKEVERDVNIDLNTRISLVT